MAHVTNGVIAQLTGPNPFLALCTSLKENIKQTDVRRSLPYVNLQLRQPQIADMTAKRGLITDTFKPVKRAKRNDRKAKRPPSPPAAEPEPSAPSESDLDLQELRKFDLDWHFGPCTGISRLQRWERAFLHGLNPPQEVKDIILKKATDPEYTHSLWRDYPL